MSIVKKFDYISMKPNKVILVRSYDEAFKLAFDILRSEDDFEEEKIDIKMVPIDTNNPVLKKIINGDVDIELYYPLIYYGNSLIDITISDKMNDYESIEIYDLGNVFNDPNEFSTYIKKTYRDIEGYLEIRNDGKNLIEMTMEELIKGNTMFLIDNKKDIINELEAANIPFINDNKDKLIILKNETSGPSWL